MRPHTGLQFFLFIPHARCIATQAFQGGDFSEPAGFPGGVQEDSCPHSPGCMHPDVVMGMQHILICAIFCCPPHPCNSPLPPPFPLSKPFQLLLEYHFDSVNRILFLFGDGQCPLLQESPGTSQAAIPPQLCTGMKVKLCGAPGVHWAPPHCTHTADTNTREDDAIRTQICFKLSLHFQHLKLNCHQISLQLSSDKVLKFTSNYKCPMRK